MRVNDCFEKRLLRKDKPDMLKVKMALEMAEQKRERALELFENSFFEESIVASYTAMFHAARALLFKDGIIERSHACVIAYLREKYIKNLGHDRVGWLDTYRLERHESFYGLESSRFNQLEAKDALDKSEKFVQSIKDVIDNT